MNKKKAKKRDLGKAQRFLALIDGVATLVLRLPREIAA